MVISSTYKDHYKQKPIRYVKPIRDAYEEFDVLPEGANFLATKINIKSDLTVALTKIQEMYKQRNRSAYMIDYVWKTRNSSLVPKKEKQQEEEEVGEEKLEGKQLDRDDKDELLHTCEKIKLKKQDVPILPPLKGSRIINGYMNAKYFHTGNTTYEEEIGVNACNWMFGVELKKNRGFLDKDRKQSRQGSNISASHPSGSGYGSRSVTGKEKISRTDCSCSECKNNGL